MTRNSQIPAAGSKLTTQTTPAQRNILLFAGMAALLVIVGMLQSWNVAFSILNMCLISAIMALGVNIQWGYAGLFNVGVMGFAALGGLAGVVISMPPVDAAWTAGGFGIVVGLVIGIVTLVLGMMVWRRGQSWGQWRYAATGAIVIGGYILMLMDDCKNFELNFRRITSFTSMVFFLLQHKFI